MKYSEFVGLLTGSIISNSKAQGVEIEDNAPVVTSLGIQARLLLAKDEVEQEEILVRRNKQVLQGAILRPVNGLGWFYDDIDGLSPAVKEYAAKKEIYFYEENPDDYSYGAVKRIKYDEAERAVDHHFTMIENDNIENAVIGTYFQELLLRCQQPQAGACSVPSAAGVAYDGPPAYTQADADRFKTEVEASAARGHRRTPSQEAAFQEGYCAGLAAARQGVTASRE